MTIEIPIYEYFQNINCYTISSGEFNIKISAGKETIKAYTWLGKYCLDKTEEKNASPEYPQSEDGYNEAVKWVNDEVKRYFPE